MSYECRAREIDTSLVATPLVLLLVKRGSPGEVLGNAFVAATIVLVVCLYVSHGSTIVEHPFRSLVWRVAAMRIFLNLLDAWACTLEQCMFGLAPSDEAQARYRSGTRLMYFNFRDACILHGIRCNKEHPPYTCTQEFVLTPK